jgi:protein-S-isoprenylcysteine O-methyltransferase Ste14
MRSETIARFRVPVGWLLGLLALWIARPRGDYLLAGVLVAAAGEGIRLWASGYLEKDRQLTTAGPYAWTRNPLYLGSFFVGVGFASRPGTSPPRGSDRAFVAVYFPSWARGVALAVTFPRLPGSRPGTLLPRFPRRETILGRLSWSQVWVNREPVTVVGLVLVVVILWAKWRFRGP